MRITAPAPAPPTPHDRPPRPNTRSRARRAHPPPSRPSALAALTSRVLAATPCTRSRAPPCVPTLLVSARFRPAPAFTSPWSPPRVAHVSSACSACRPRRCPFRSPLSSRRRAVSRAAFGRRCVLAPVPLVFAALFLFPRLAPGSATGRRSTGTRPYPDPDRGGGLRRVQQHLPARSPHRITLSGSPTSPNLPTGRRGTRTPPRWLVHSDRRAGILTARSERGTLPIASELPENLFSFLAQVTR